MTIVNIKKQKGTKKCVIKRKLKFGNQKTTSNRVLQETAEATGDLIGNKIANKITGVSKNLETVTNEHDKEIPKEGYVSPKERQKVIDHLRLI